MFFILIFLPKAISFHIWRLECICIFLLFTKSMGQSCAIFLDFMDQTYMKWPLLYTKRVCHLVTLKYVFSKLICLLPRGVAANENAQNFARFQKVSTAEFLMGAQHFNTIIHQQLLSISYGLFHLLQQTKQNCFGVYPTFYNDKGYFLQV